MPLTLGSINALVGFHHICTYPTADSVSVPNAAHLELVSSGGGFVNDRRQFVAVTKLGLQTMGSF